MLQYKSIKNLLSESKHYRSNFYFQKQFKLCIVSLIWDLSQLSNLQKGIEFSSAWIRPVLHLTNESQHAKKHVFKRLSLNQKKKMKLPIAFPPEGSMVCLGDMYDFAVLPKSRTVGIAQVYRTLWRHLPANQCKSLIETRLFEWNEQEKWDRQRPT